MTEKLGGQIDVKQQEIESLKGPAAAKTEISRYRNTYVNAVDSGQTEMLTAAGKLKSPEAKAYLKKASGEIAGQLGSMADRGREIIKAHEDTKEGKPEKVPSMDQLSGDLSKKLGQLKKSIDAFKVLEEIENDDLPKVEKANGKLNSSEGSKDPLTIFSAKEKLLGDLNRLSPKFISTPGSREYSKKVVKKYQDLAKKIGEEKDELALGPTARHIIANDFFKSVSTYETLVKAVESNPSMETLRAAEAQAEKIDPVKAHAEIFDEKEEGSYAYINNMYKHLETEFEKSKSSYEGLKDSFEEAEKEALTKAAEKMIADIASAEKETVGPLWDKYEPLSRRTDLNGKELEDYEKNEKALLSAYLTLKMTVSPFVNKETQYKLQGDIYGKVQAKIKEIDDRVRQIEVNRQTRKSMASLGEVGANVFSYVTFLGEEKDGKIYTFNAAYDALSDDKKQEVRMAVESIIARDQAEVKAETQKAMVELSKSTGNFDQISEVLGEKSKKYAEGLQLLASGKHTEAVAAFEAYVGQTFSAEERELNSAALADAQEKIRLVKYSGDFYEGLKQYGAGDINAASKSLASYVKWAEGSGDKELHKEQINQAREVLHLIGLTKVKQLDNLLEDVKYWKKKDLQDRYGKNGEKIDFRITGPEVDVIVDGIRGLKSKVQKGELIDYDEEFAKLKASVHLYLQKNAFDPKNNVIDKFSELYEGMNSTDPEVRKKTCIKFAKELRDLRGYDKAREYLDKALADEYREAAKDVSQEKIMREMLGDKMIMDNVRKAASAYLTEFKKDNPDIPEDQLRKQAEQIVFNMWLQKRYSRELRHHMTGQGLADSTEALSLYNNWSPYEEDKDTSWYKPWNYEYMSAEEYDQFKDAAKENLALTIATLPIGFGAGAVGAQIGKVAFRSLATRLLIRTGAAGAEAAILAIEEGGVQAIRFGSQAWKALTPQMQRAIILSRVGAGALSVTVEGTLLLGGSTVAEGIITGQSTPITSANLVESIFKALAFRGIGTAGNKIFGNAIKAGGSRGMKALIAMESMSGLAGTGIEAASLYAKGHGDSLDTGFVLRSLLENAITSTGMHWAHGKLEGGARKGRNKIEEAYSKQVAEEAPSKLGFDASKPETIKTARVTADGEVIINGRTMKDFDVHALAHLPKEARQKVLDLNPNSALDTHFKSKFSTEVPKELLPDGDPARANEIHGWIDKDGKIHYNLDHLNAGTSEGGPYRGKKILPEGYTAKVNKKGDLVIAGPNGKDMGLRDFLKTPEGKQSSIMDEMKRIKNHEATHQAIESAYSKMEKGIPIEDSSKTNSVKDMFARPDVDGRIPEGKIPLVDHNGNPMEPTWQNVQEYLCHVGDGSIKVPPELMQHFERVLARQIPGFKFSRARQISTKMLATKPKEAFARTHIAADHVGEPWKKIGSMEDLGSAMKSEKTEQSNYKIAEQLMGDFMSVLRTGDKAQIEMFKDNNSAFIDRKVLDQFESGYQSSVDRLGKKMTTPEGLKELAVLESQGGMNVFDRILSKQLVNEAKLVSDLTSHNHPDGTPKSPQEMAADMQRLKQNIDFGTIELSPLALRHLSATPEGIAFIRYGLRHGHLESFATLPEPVKQKLVSEAHDRSLYRVKKGMESLKEKITKTKEKIDAGEIDDDGGQRKIDDMEARLKAYEKLSRMSKEDFQKAFEKMDTDGHPPGFEEMPKLTELLMGNADKLNVDFMVAMLDGKMKYQEVGTGSGKRKVMYVEGRLLGVGGLGEAWSVAAFEAGAKTPHEMVMKKSKVPPHVDEAMTDFMNLDRDVRYDIDDLVDNFVKVGIKTEGGLNLALKRAKELPLDSHHFQELNSYLSRLQAAHNEAQNVKLIMEHQAKGELTSFTKFHYVTDSNAIFMESIAVPRANYQVCDYEKIMAGDVTSLDGKKPISQKKFWGGLADIMDSIGEAHALGFVHRDIKPENFGIGPDGKIRLIDAGSVKTKASMGKVDYLELPSDPYHLDHTEGRSEYYYPYEGGITLHYYDGSISYHESKGTIDADGKPKVNFGGSDRFAMARSLEEILNTQAEAGKPKWANKEQTQKIRDIIAYLKKPRSDINVAAQRLRDVMAIHD